MNKKTILIFAFILILIIPSMANINSLSMGKINLEVPEKSDFNLESNLENLNVQGKKKHNLGGFITNKALWPKLFFSILSRNKEFYPGDILKLDIDIFLSNISNIEGINLTYKIISIDGIEIYTEKERKMILGNVSFIKQIQIPQDIFPQEYIIFLSFFYKDELMMSGWKQFLIKEKKEEPWIFPVKIKTIFWLIPIINIMILIIILLFLKKYKNSF